MSDKGKHIIYLFIYLTLKQFQFRDYQCVYLSCWISIKHYYLDLNMYVLFMYINPQSSENVLCVYNTHTHMHPKAHTRMTMFFMSSQKYWYKRFGGVNFKSLYSKQKRRRFYVNDVCSRSLIFKERCPNVWLTCKDFVSNCDEQNMLQNTKLVQFYYTHAQFMGVFLLYFSV